MNAVQYQCDRFGTPANEKEKKKCIKEELIQIFGNDKQHFYSFIKFYVINLKYQGQKFDNSITLSTITEKQTNKTKYELVLV